MASANPGERASSFAMACSLLSRYVRQNGAAAGELGLGIRGEATIPGSSAENGDARKKTMELFPQNVGFGSGNAAQETADASNQEKRQLTIFYGGKVVVFDDFPSEKAKDLMQLASKGVSPAPTSALPPSSVTAAVTESIKVSVVPTPASALPAVAQVNAQKPVRPTPTAADLPQARKASLHRFLEKRKDRLNSKAPYASSDATPVKKELPENQPWLGLGPQAASPNVSLGRECS